MSLNVFKCSSNNENSVFFLTYFCVSFFLFETVHNVYSRCEQSFNSFSNVLLFLFQMKIMLSIRDNSLECFDFLLRLTALLLFRADILASVDGG